MQNLACHNPSLEDVTKTNRVILNELAKAGINVVPNAGPVENSEVPTNFTGRIGDFTFRRAWYYWVVYGKVPLETAKKIYLNPNGRKDVRVNGHCGCPSPEEGSMSFDVESNKTLVEDKEFERGIELFKNRPESLKDWTENYMPESKSKSSKEFVTSYHIDTQEGLNFFIQALRNDKVV